MKFSLTSAVETVCDREQLGFRASVRSGADDGMDVNVSFTSSLPRRLANCLTSLRNSMKHPAPHESTTDTL